MVNPWKARAPKHRGGGAARYAHGNGVALRASARRLSVIATAVCAASAMMLSYVVAFTAKGDSTLTGGAWDSSIKDAGAISPPQTLSLGDNVTTTNKPDTGVATYVGGNMYIGEKIDSNGKTVQYNLNHETGITGSYAAEAEGLTLVDGRLAMRQVKKSWGGQGFRFGVVGFGSQFRPDEKYKDDNGVKQDASVLAVRGLNKSGITQLMTDKDTDIAAWGTGQANNYGGGWVGYPKGGREFRYMATVPRSNSSVAREWHHDREPKYTSLARVLDGTRNEGGWDTLKDPSKSFKINGVEYANFGKTLQSQSSELASFKANGTYTMDIDAPAATGNAPAAKDLTRYKYDYYKREVYNKQTIDSYKFEFTGGVNEKLITLTGDGKSALQVFNVKASDLSTDGKSTDGKKYSGVDFWFRNIPDAASVVVNVVNDDGTSTSTNTLDFHNGWRMWWGGNNDSNITDPDVTEIGGYYSYTKKGSDNEPNIYAKRAQQVLWNFPYTTQLTIRGGQGSGKQTVKYGFNTDNEKKKLAGKKVTKPMATTGDDPAAAWIGSIYVPQGGFQSHVSTNGRVYVGGDFEMDNPMEVHYKDNPTAVHYSDGSPFINFEGGNSASVIDMDQERHNLPWNAYYTQDSSAIGWGKVDNSDGKTTLSGASWSVYGSLDDAKSDTAKAIISVTDNGSNDWSNKEGKVVVKGLKPNANYFIKETKEPEGYRLNTNIYTVQTKQTGDANVNFLTSLVYDKNGTQVTTSDDQMMHSFTAADGRTAYAIGDKKKGGSVSWMKYAEGDSSKTGLAGSSWTLEKTKTDTSPAASWTVNDNTTAATGITLTQGDTTVSGGSVQVEAYKTITLKASVAPAEASQQVTWKSSNTNFAVVTDGVVTGIAAGTSTITACSVTNSSICSRVTVTVSAVNVNSLTVTSDGSTVAEASGDADKKVSAEADVKMFVNKTQLFQATVDPNTVATSWSALDPDIVSVSDSGLVTAKKTGSTTVVATAGNKSVRLHVTVINVDSSKMVVYFHHTESESGWTGDVYLKYQKNDGTWPAAGNYVKMKQASCSGDYVYAIIDRATSGKQFLFSNNNTNDSTANWYKATGNANFSFTGGSAITVGVGKATDGAPSGTSCPTEVTSDLVDSQATMAAAKTSGTVINATGKTLSTGTGTSHASDAVVRTTTDSVKPSLRLAADTDTLEDTDSGVGKFTVKDLDDGTYTLKEATAPVGYTLNATSYSFTVKDGKVAWTGDAPSLVNADGVLQVPDTPTVVKWYKVDGSNANDPSHSGKLAGSQWQITDASGDVFCLADNNAKIDPSRCMGDTTTYQDADAQDGVISVKGLPVGTYKLKETVAPTLYQLADTEYKFKVTDNASATVEVTGSVTGNNIPNKRMTGTVKWKKTDENGEVGGSQWQLILYPDAPNTKPDARSVIDWSDSSSTTNSNCPEADAWNCDVDSKAGWITLKNLPWGKYVLTETKAPAGHQLATDTYTFTIVRASQSNSMERTLLNIDKGSIENETSITSLPLTGGEWTPRNVVIAGLIVLGVAAVSYGIARRRRRK
ncbi:choice-of-anchor A family protein [Bifidobacterium boum]|uniref:Choice-of-anchor A family protein n=1 Tax=Bifidobacterium boum TaxID=78343 RepID=A0A848D490_9BIFI|nr:SpaA isopeptide-forming pilin-related protein [Bifidobacterium boum]NMF02319.1 choice-of-anchor A family protein [Bifidobacterium boum]